MKRTLLGKWLGALFGMLLMTALSFPVMSAPSTTSLSDQEMAAILGGHAYLYGYVYQSNTSTGAGGANINANGSWNSCSTTANGSGYFQMLCNADTYRVQANWNARTWWSPCYGVTIVHTNVGGILRVYPQPKPPC